MNQSLFQHLKDSPDAVLVVKRFEDYLKSEAVKRQGFFDLVHENIKAEFINGEIVLHSPVRRKHWQISNQLSYLFNHFLQNNPVGEIGVEKVMIALSRNCYEPDIVFYRKAISDTFSDDQKLFPAPDLIVEILSKSTWENDYGIKFQDYAAHGVGEYWIVDPSTETIEQYVLLDGRFELQNKLVKTGVLTSLAVNGFQLAVDKVFA